MARKRTRWFPSDVYPVRKGVYEIEHAGHVFFSYWNGVNWGLREYTEKEAYYWRVTPTSGPVSAWRGLVRRTRNGGKK